MVEMNAASAYSTVAHTWKCVVIVVLLLGAACCLRVTAMEKQMPKLNYGSAT